MIPFTKRQRERIRLLAFGASLATMLTIGAMNGERTVLGWIGFGTMVIVVIVLAVMSVRGGEDS